MLKGMRIRHTPDVNGEEAAAPINRLLATVRKEINRANCIFARK
jgi:hypothetical protein